MTTFTIDNENNITAFAELEDALNHRIGSTEGAFASEEELSSLSSTWPIGRFAEVWNGFAGVVPFDQLKPVKKFTDRKTAVARIWKAVQALTPCPAQHVAPAAPEQVSPPTEAKPTRATPQAREGSKKAMMIEMLKRADGATLSEIVAATGWEKHSVRGFISGGLGKRMGLSVESFKTPEGARAFRITQ
jgi:hypothetical protein